MVFNFRKLYNADFSIRINKLQNRLLKPNFTSLICLNIVSLSIDGCLDLRHFLYYLYGIVRLKIPVFIKRISNTLFTKSTKRERQAFQLQLQRTEEYKQTQSELNVRTEQIDQNRVKPSWSIKTDIAKLKYHHKIASFGVFQQEAQLKYDSNHIKSQPVLNHQSEICNEQISRQKFDYINRDNESSCSDFRATRNNSPVKTYARNTERLSKFNKLLKSKFRSKHNFLFCRKLKI